MFGLEPSLLLEPSFLAGLIQAGALVFVAAIGGLLGLFFGVRRERSLNETAKGLNETAIGLNELILRLPFSQLAEVTEVSKLDPPNYDDFVFLRDCKVIDLRTWREIPEGKEEEPHSPVHWFRIVTARKIREDVSTLRFQFTTSGLGIDARCLTHDYSGKKVVRETSDREIRLSNRWELILDVSDIRPNQEFMIILEVVYWNSYGKTNSDWSAFPVVNGSKEMEVLLLFPESRPSTKHELFLYPRDTTDIQPFRGDHKIFPSHNGLSIFWKIDNPRAGYVYQIDWEW